MAKVSVKLRTSAVSGNKGVICYQLTHRREIRRLTSGIRLLPGQWDASAQRIIASEPDDAAGLQRRIEGDLNSLRRIIRELDAAGMPYTVRDIVSRFRLPSSNFPVLSFIRGQIEQLAVDNRFGTARNYQRALNSFSVFLGGVDIPFAAFSESLVGEYNVYLKRRGVVRNTISFYMRILRSIYNKAVRLHLAEQTFPFQNVYTGIDRTCKRAVGEEVICRLNRLDLRDSAALSFARDLFIFSYGTRGMAFVDLAYLRKTNVCGDMLRYTRHKTGQQLSVRLESCIKKIAVRYADRSRSLPYLFPILTSEDPVQAYAQYQVALNYYNRLLKKLSKRLKLEQGLSSYTSRHSWATAARNHNVPLPVISAGMGHTSERTTQIYLMMLENSVIDRANHGIVASLERYVSL